LAVFVAVSVINALSVALWCVAQISTEFCWTYVCSIPCFGTHCAGDGG